MAKAKAQEIGFVSKASLENTRVSPQKARLVVDMIRGQQVETALDILGGCDKKTAPLVKKLLLSAVANASDRAGVNVDELYIKRAWVDAGRTHQRSMPRARGSASPIKKRHSRITLLLDEVGAR